MDAREGGGGGGWGIDTDRDFCGTISYQWSKMSKIGRPGGQS
jgi:hypothetical protein